MSWRICCSAWASESIARERSIAAPSACASETKRLMSLSSKRRRFSEAATSDPKPPNVRESGSRSSSGPAGRRSARSSRTGPRGGSPRRRSLPGPAATCSRLGGRCEGHLGPRLGLGPADIGPQGQRLAALVALPDLAAIDAELVDRERHGALQKLVEGHALERDLPEVEHRRSPAGIGVELALALAALACIAEVNGEEPRRVELDRRRRDVDRDLAAVGPAGPGSALRELVTGFVDLAQQDGTNGHCAGACRGRSARRAPGRSPASARGRRAARRQRSRGQPPPLTSIMATPSGEPSSSARAVGGSDAGER